MHIDTQVGISDFKNSLLQFYKSKNMEIEK